MTSRLPFPPTRPALKDVSRRAFLSSVALGSMTLAVSGCSVISGGAVAPGQKGLRLSKEPAAGRQRTVELYNIFGSIGGDAFVKLAELYERSQTHTAVRVTYAPQSGSAQVRLLTAIAAETPPDLAFIQPDQYPQLAALGVMAPLDDYLKRAGLGKDDYVPAVWDQMSATGKVFDMPAMVDPNFPFFWNKKVFAAAGLDPEVPPKTIDDLERMSDAILKKEGNRVTRIGTVPWNYYGFSNSMFTLGFAFGGKFMSDDNEVATADDSNIVQALTWMCDYAKRVGGAGSIAVSSPTQTLPVIAGGQIGMAPMTVTDAGVVYSNGDPAVVELGATLFPYAEGLGSPGSGTWLGGWSLFIPTKSKNRDAAWDFLQFVSASDDGTLADYRFQRAVTGMAHSPALRQLQDDPKLTVFRDALVNCKNVRPTIPVAATYMQQLDIQVSAAVFGQITPELALKRVTAAVNSDWDEFRKEHP